MRCLPLVLMALYAVSFAWVCPAKAEDNTMTLCDHGVQNISSRLVVGWTGTNNNLVVTGGASLLSENGEVGLGGSFNRILVSGQGSSWFMKSALKVGTAGGWNQAIVANGASMTTGVAEGATIASGAFGVIGDNTGIPGNSVVITDPGSTWSVNGGLVIGWGGMLSSFVISNGGRAFSMHASMSMDPQSVSNSVLVTGPNSRWDIDGLLIPGIHGAGNCVRVADGAILTATSLKTYSPSNSIEISGGYLFLTNRPQAPAFGVSLPAGLQWKALPWTNALILETNSILCFELDGYHAGNALPFIAVSGPAYLGGTLKVRLASGFQPARGAVFSLMTHEKRIGAFQNISPGGRVSTVDGSGSFRLILTDSVMQLTDYEPSKPSLAETRLTPLPKPSVKTNLQPLSSSSTTSIVATSSASPLSSPILRCVLRENLLGLEFPWTADRVHHLWVSTNLQTWTEIPSPLFEFPTPQIGRWKIPVSTNSNTTSEIHVFRLSVE